MKTYNVTIKPHKNRFESWIAQQTYSRTVEARTCKEAEDLARDDWARNVNYDTSVYSFKARVAR